MQDKIDLLVDSDGDLVIDDTGDLDTATPLQTVQQDVSFRATTGHFDYAPDPYIGANLASYRGKPNTRRTGDYMKADLFEALTKDGRFSRSTIVVDCVPVSKTRVALPVLLRETILGTEDEMATRTAVPVVTITVDFTTSQITSIAGGLR